MRKKTPQNNQRNKSIVTNCDKFHREKWPAKEIGLLINMTLDTNILECPGYFLALKNEIFFLDFFFLMWTIFEVFIEVVKILLLFYVLLFWLRHMGS